MTLAPLAMIVALLARGLPPQDEKKPVGPVSGTTAPEFKLNDHEGKLFRLGENPDGLWTIIAFYPRAKTPG